MSSHRSHGLALASLLFVSCVTDDAVPTDAGPPDGGPPTEEQCDRDPLIPGCTPTERPPFAGLGAEVEILRDEDGVVHVYGGSDRDAFYASGYMQAFDRMFQMDMSRRRALGRTAEVLGASVVSDDRLVRVMDLPRWARTNEAALFRDRPELWELVQAWVEGVNARIREVRGTAELPAEFGTLGYEPEEWAVSDAFAFGKLVLFGNANQLESSILAAIIQQYLTELDGRLGLLAPIRDSYVMPPDERPASASLPIVRGGEPLPHVPPLEIPADARERLAEMTRQLAPFRSGGSNNWAIDGAHTATGRPLIAGDPHQALQSPSLFWLHHLDSATAGGNLDVIGFNFVGGPAIQLGHNRDIAWTATTTYADMMDIWDVRVVDGVATVGDATAAVHTRRETIVVAGAAPVELVLEDVPGYGVLLPDDLSPLPIGRPGRRLLFNWTGFGVTHEFESFYGFDTAATRDEFDAAADGVELGLFNFVAADAQGITYRSTPRVPDRGDIGTRRPYALLDGDDEGSFWSGAYLTLDRLPHSRGGARGWIATANNDPFGFTADGSTEGDPWYFGVIFDPGLRSARIESEITRLVARGDVNIADMQALQDDSYSILADDFIPVLLEDWATIDSDPLLASFRGRPELDALVTGLGAWDRRMERAASEPVAFNAFMFFLARRVLQDDLSLIFQPLMDASISYVVKFLSNVLRGRAPDSESFFAGEPRAVSVARALEETAMYLTEQFGTAGYTWGAIHGTRFAPLYGERLDPGWVATDGAEGTVDVSSTAFFDGDGNPRARLESGGGSIYRMVASFREDGTPEALVNVPRGVSGDPASPHWDDLQSDWLDARYRPLRFSRAEIEAGPTERMTLAP